MLAHRVPFPDRLAAPYNSSRRPSLLRQRNASATQCLLSSEEKAVHSFIIVSEQIVPLSCIGQSSFDAALPPNRIVL
jgi:hypothetical protein